MTSEATPPDGAPQRDAAAPSSPIVPTPPPANDAAATAGRPERPASKAARPPRKQKRRARDGAVVGYMSGVLTFLTLCALAAGGVLFWAKGEFDGPGPLEKDTTVMIARNQGVVEIADTLQRAGVIDQPLIFKAGVQAYGVKDRLRYGEYAFPARVSMREALEIIVSGKSIELSVTIPEGLTSLQIVDRLRDNDMMSGEIREVPAEGALLPETYNFTRGAPREQILDRMKRLRDKAVDEVWRKRDPSVRIKTAEELVILASLIEKETGIDGERPQVAAVFANRLARGMRLQSDPTIVYGLVGGRGTLGRSLTRADIQSRTAYNTYVVQGLPAGPIANPGRESLEAAANPARTKDLYFVADGTGGHAFAPSLVEHNRNVARWRQIERTRGAPADRLAPDEQTPEVSSEAAEPAPAAGADAAPATAAPASSARPKSGAAQPARPKPSSDRRPPRDR